MVTSDYEIVKDKKNRNRIKVNDYGKCPDCKKGNLEHKDYCDRICRGIGGEAKIYQVPRGECDLCGSVHRILPDFMIPYRQYAKDVIDQVRCGNVTIEDGLDFPCEMTIVRWKKH